MAALELPQLFINAVTSLLKDEGGYINDKYDTGGETKFGISKRSYPTLNIKHLTKEDAIYIYYKDWWCIPLIETIVNPVLKVKVFNIAINMGVKGALKCLQRAVRGISDNECLLDDDGILGPKTLKALEKYNIQEGLYYAFKSEVCSYYRMLKNPRFENGWLNRGYSK